MIEDLRTFKQALGLAQPEQLERQAMAMFVERIRNSGGVVSEQFRLNERGGISLELSKLHRRRVPVENGRIIAEAATIGLLDFATPTSEYIPEGLKRKKSYEFTTSDVVRAADYLRGWFPEVEITFPHESSNEVFSYVATLNKEKKE